jgi:hypothetical protein
MSGQKRRFVDLLSTFHRLPSRPQAGPHPPSGLFGDIWGQAEAMDNGQWTVDNEQKMAIIHYQLCTIHCAPPTPPWLHSVAFGTRCAREEKREHEAFCRLVTLSPSHLVIPTPHPPLRGIRGHSGTGIKPGSGGDGERGRKMPAQIRLGRAKFQLLRAKFELFRDIWGTFWTRCLA